MTASTAGGSYYLGAGRIRASSAFIDITIAQPYIALKSNPTAVRRGEGRASADPVRVLRLTAPEPPNAEALSVLVVLS